MEENRFDGEKRYVIDQIRSLCVEKLKEEGVEGEDARGVVDSMLAADINGVETHGIRMFPKYISRLKTGQFNIGEIKIIKQTPAFTVIDANNCVGAISAIKATDIAILNAQKYGLHVVFSRNCNTYGPAFYFAELIANRGLIGLTCCNSPAAMPAVNGVEKMIGTNPFAYACPTESYGNLVIDMATSVVAKSRLEIARINGEQIQAGWALDKNGNPTTDPVEAIEGFVLPMAGFKGYGIALIIDMLSGMLSGASYLNKVGKFYSEKNEGMDVGHFFMAIDPMMVYDGNFYKAMDTYIDTIKCSKTVSGKEIIVPGDDRKKKKEEALKKGVRLTDNTVLELEKLLNTKLILEENSKI